MPDQVECYIGCPKDGTVLFRVDRVKRNAGVFEHEPVALTEATDRFICAICGGPLSRVDPKADYLQPVLAAEAQKEVAADVSALRREPLVVQADVAVKAL